jgi:hypothetical protein
MQGVGLFPGPRGLLNARIIHGNHILGEEALQTARQVDPGPAPLDQQQGQGADCGKGRPAEITARGDSGYPFNY